MAAGYVTKVVGDGNSGTFSARFWCPDTSASPQLLFAGGVITDGAGNLVDFTAVSPVRIDQTTPGTTNLVAAGQSGVWSTTPTPRAAANGTTSSRVVAAASTNATSLKASAGNITEIDVFNVAAYDVFLKFYNKASAPTIGTDTPVWTIPIKAGTGYAREFALGKSFATGIAYAITKLQADSDTTVTVAGDVTGAIDWI